jgi:hypothetical protein
VIFKHLRSRMLTGIFKYSTYFLSVYTGLFLTSCQKDTQQEAVQAISMQVNTENVDAQLFSCQTVEQVQALLDKHPYLSQVYFTDLEIPPTQLAPQLFQLIQNPVLRDFYAELDSLIGDRDQEIILPLTSAFKKIKYHFPSFEAPKVKFMVTGFMGNDLYVSDSLIVIGLDYFGGKNATYRPDVFDYQLTRYQKEYIVPSIVFFIANRYNMVRKDDQTLLTEMIGYGKDYEFVKQVLPQVPDSLILGYSGEALSRTYNSQSEIWAYFVSAKLLYDKTEIVKQKYTGERPYTMEIGPKVPGGIGRWIGWRIVSQYMAKFPETTLPELMGMDHSVDLLQKSGYHGQLDSE